MKSPGKLRNAAGSGRRDAAEGAPGGTEAYADCKFLTVTVTVFQIFKNRRSFIHADFRRLLHSTYRNGLRVRS